MAQYHAKENGRNRVELFVPALHPISRRRLDHEEALRQRPCRRPDRCPLSAAGRSGQRPIVGAEALARWNHPRRGRARRRRLRASGRGVRSDPGVRCRGPSMCHRVPHCLAHAGCGRDFRVWCNVSAHQLTTVDPLDDFWTSSSRQVASREGIGIELTETAVMAHLEDAARHIDAAAAGSSSGTGRFRHRALVTGAPTVPGRRRAQGGQEFRLRHRRRQTGHGNRPCDDLARKGSWVAGSGRGSRRPWLRPARRPPVRPCPGFPVVAGSPAGTVSRPGPHHLPGPRSSTTDLPTEDLGADLREVTGVS